MAKFNPLLVAMIVMFAPQSISHAANRCNDRASLPWKAGNQTLTLEAISNGPECGKAIVVLVVRNANGEPLWTFVSRAADVAMFAPDHTANGKNMTGALKKWLAVGLNSNRKDMGTLPDWKQGADGPAEDPPSEFSFTVSANLDHKTYVGWRKAKRPLFCFVQGMESENCITVSPEGTIVDVGIQSFPG